ncbi:MAG: hypothetical protein AABY04_02125 [Candidatus Micrarchaeota archaeon]
MQNIFLLVLIALLMLGCTENNGSSKNQTFGKNTSIVSANATDAYSFCKLLEDEYVMDCLFDKAIEIRDEFGCDRLNGSQKDRCLIEIANSSRKLSLCDKVSSINRGKCRSVLEGFDSKIFNCYNLENAQIDECFLNMGLKANSSFACQRIGNKKIKDKCAQDIAKSSGNSSVCLEIAGIGGREKCLYENAIMLDLPSICDGIDSPLENQCNFELGILANDENLCSKITDDRNLMNACFLKVAKIKISPHICARIDANESLRDECFGTIARLNRNQDLCYKISANATREDCYRFIAAKDSNQTLCFEIISSARTRDLCLYDIAVSTGNYTACVNVNDLFLKKGCLAYISGGN